LAKGDEEAVVIDREDRPGVDVVGDVTETRTLEEAGIGEAKSVVLALDSDVTTIFAALAIRQAAPEVEVIARANDESSMPKLYRAGVGYALSLATITGRIIASALLDEEVLRPETQVELVRTAAPRLVDQSLGEADVRARTGATVIAVDRDGRLLTDIGPDTVVADGDELVVAGSDEAVARFSDLAT
ncbi:MAG: TrkA family potassium uptake protein, partial [Halobaculum sp.]